MIDSRETATLVYEEDMLCVAQVAPCDYKPEMETWIWPVRRISRHDCEHVLGETVHYDRGGGYYFRRNYNTFSFPLLNGGKTEALRIEKQPIPCPKVRKGVPTRYQGGQWQKYMKSTGWIAA